MTPVLNFKRDRRISRSERAELRDFASEAGKSIEELADRLGLRVDEEDLPSDVSAVLLKSPWCGSASGFRIAVNRVHSLERRRLSIAHEIGHFVLHRNDPAFDPVEDESEYGEVVPLFAIKGNSYRANGFRPSNSRLEIEANQFAACLLMPMHLVRSNVNYRLGATKNLARDFIVSIPAMKLRLVEIRDLCPGMRSSNACVA